jgi:hypothetical protein
VKQSALVAVPAAALLLLQVPLALRDLWRDARSVPLARRVEGLRAPERVRIANAFAATSAGWRPEYMDLERAFAAAATCVPPDGTLRIVPPDDLMLGLVGDRFAALLYPRAVRFHAWPLGEPLPPPATPRPEFWILRLGEPHDPSADPGAEVLATGALFTLWHVAGAGR